MRAGRSAAATAAAAALLCLLMAPAGAQESAERRQLDEAKRRIAAVSSQLAGARDRAADARADLAAADAQLREVEAAVNLAGEAVARQGLAVEEAAAELARTQQEAEHVRAQLESRAVELFKRGATRSYEMLLSGGDISEALERTEFVRVLTLSDRGQLEGLSAARVAVAADRDRLAVQQAELEALEAEQRALLEQVRELRDSTALRAAQSAGEARHLADQKENLERDAQRLTALIRARSSPSRSTGSPSTAGYIWPRCDRVTSEFGRRWGRMHAGIDIDGNTGDPIFAAKAGTVAYAGWHGGYGRLVLIDHGDGVVTAYAHMSSFSVGEGQSVDRGQRLGSVGASGNSTGSHLHFETRVNSDAVNPRRFLPPGC
ncbi:MAG TPA: peptidoglycan DD-metalloendopeptidase family protein [Nitriliruptorales bacterium]